GSPEEAAEPAPFPDASKPTDSPPLPPGLSPCPGSRRHAPHACAPWSVRHPPRYLSLRTPGRVCASSRRLPGAGRTLALRRLSGPGGASANLSANRFSPRLPPAWAAPLAAAAYATAVPG